jgi:predicted PurR-regulated permease PerM
MTEITAPPVPETKYKTVAEDKYKTVVEDKVVEDKITATATADEAIRPDHVVHIPVDARGAALCILALVGLIFALAGAQKFLIPLIVGILIAYTLNPLVVSLARIRVPRVAGTIVVLLAVIGALGFCGYSLRGQVQTIIEQLPEAFPNCPGLFGAAIPIRCKSPGRSKEIEKATNQATGVSSAGRSAATPMVEQQAFKLTTMLWAGWLGRLIRQPDRNGPFLVFSYWLPAYTFKRKLVKLTGPSLAKKKITVNILDDINESIQRYMFVLLATNLMVALFSHIAFRLIGLEMPVPGRLLPAVFMAFPTLVRR